jgi:hypothetical protein
MVSAGAKGGTTLEAEQNILQASNPLRGAQQLSAATHATFRSALALL